MKCLRRFNEILTLKNAHHKDGRHLLPSDLSIIKNASLIYNQDSIIWIGPDDELPTHLSEYQITTDQVTDCSGKVLTPELVDSHTHLVFGGDRSFEYAMRLNGESYESIAMAGGGIKFTASETNQNSRHELFKLGAERIRKMKSLGVGTIEIKSGYALNFDKELELSQIIHDLKTTFAPNIQILRTYMAAHAIPLEFKSSYDYVKEVVLPLLDILADESLIDFVDVFHEQNYFSSEDVRAIFERAHRRQLKVRMHADELNDNGGAALALEYSALSADHLLKINHQHINHFKTSSTVATLLPGTGLFLGKDKAPGRMLLDAGAKVAIASDFNPGSCHCDNLLLLASLAAPMYSMNQAELWASITLNAAHSLGLNDQGALVEGLKPRFTIFNAPSINHLTYHWGVNFAQ